MAGRRGGARGAYGGIERRGLDAKAAKPVRKCMNYLTKNGRHYDRTLAEGLPIATGGVEGARGHLVQIGWAVPARARWIRS